MSDDQDRTKGPRFEEAVVKAFRRVMPDALEGHIRRGIQQRDGGAGEPDVLAPMFFIECKHWRLCRFRDAMRQAVSDCPPSRIPLAICKDDEGLDFPVVMMRDRDFLSLIALLWNFLRAFENTPEEINEFRPPDEGVECTLQS